MRLVRALLPSMVVVMLPSEIARINLVLHDTGAMSIEGNVGDVRMAIRMIDAAREAVAARLGRPSLIEPHGAGLQIPSYDVGAAPSPLYPVLPIGDRQ